MNLPGGWELILVVLVIMVLFGAKRLPEASRSLGRSMRIFKAETKGLREDDEAVPPVPHTTVQHTTVHDTSYAPTPVAPPTPIVPPAPEQAQQRP